LYRAHIAALRGLELSLKRRQSGAEKGAHRTSFLAEKQEAHSSRSTFFNWNIAS